MRQVALLRGINVGGHKKIEMARLRQIVQALGFDDVRTHVQSGNVVFTTDTTPEQAAREMERQIAEELGLTVRVLVRTRDELARVVERNPLRDVASDPARFFVTFLSVEPDASRLREIDPAAFAPDTFAVGEREIYVWCPNGLRETRLTHAFWEKLLATTATARNWNTVTKLLALADG